MTWAWVGTAWLSAGVLLAEAVYARVLKEDPDDPGNNYARLYASVALCWPGIILFGLIYRVQTGEWPEKK